MKKDDWDDFATGWRHFLADEGKKKVYVGFKCVQCSLTQTVVLFNDIIMNDVTSLKKHETGKVVYFKSTLHWRKWLEFAESDAAAHVGSY